MSSGGGSRASLHHRFLIALHSPNALRRPPLKPDCSCALQRKTGTVTSEADEQSVLSSPVWSQRIAKFWHFSVFQRKASGVSLQFRLRGGARRPNSGVLGTASSCTIIGPAQNAPRIIAVFLPSAPEFLGLFLVTYFTGPKFLPVSSVSPLSDVERYDLILSSF